MRTDREIIDFYESRKNDDWMGTMAGDLLSTLPAEAVKPYLKDDADPEEWEPDSREPEAVIERMRDYMAFAWDKATGHRGISAGRSIDHFRAWLFLAGDDDLLAFAEDQANYPQYGAPILMAICEKYGFALPDDGWSERAARRMAKGLECREDGCMDGCGAP